MVRADAGVHSGVSMSPAPQEGAERSHKSKALCFAMNCSETQPADHTLSDEELTTSWGSSFLCGTAQWFRKHQLVHEHGMISKPFVTPPYIHF